MRARSRRLAPVATLAAFALGACGTSGHRTPSNASTTKRHVAASQLSARDPVLARLGLPPVRGRSPLPGYLMIADRDNGRLIIVNPAKQIVWRFPPPGGAGVPFGGPDDAFVSADRRYISTNEELSDTIAVITLAAHPRIVWRFGHQEVQGSAPGYLAHPDDAYLLANGQIQVADIINCRLLWISWAKQIVHSIGSAGNCAHDPPAALSDPNGDTPLPDGGVLVTEIGGWVDRLDRAGRLLWSIKTPTDYPSDAQLLPNGNVLVAGYNSPGRIDILTPHGQIVWTYQKLSGPGELNQPSLAVMMPNGMIAANDDDNDRVVVIDPRTDQIVWQYGHDGVPGSAPGYLRKPDGIDLIP